MNPQAILEKIQEDARLTAQQILSDADSKVAQIQAASKQKIEALHDATLKQAKSESEQLEQRMHRMAQLENRKELLSKKRELIDQAFQLAGEKLAAMDAKQAREFFLSQAVKAAFGDETVILGAKRTDFSGDDFIGALNDALKKAGKPANMTLSKETREGVTGLVLQSNGAEINLTNEAILESQRAELETQVASTLFAQ